MGEEPDDALSTGDGIISYQVVREFLKVATRKFARRLSANDAALYLAQVLDPLCRVGPSRELYASALAILDRFQYSFCEALIIASALRGGCHTLYSEDLHDGQAIEGMTILNPFRTAS